MEDRPKIEFPHEAVSFLTDELTAVWFQTDWNYEPSHEAAQRILEEMTERFGLSFPQTHPRKSGRARGRKGEVSARDRKSVV